MTDSESSETINLIIITRRTRFKLFCRLYWKTLVIFITPIILLPIAFIKEDNAYKCFYVFLIMVVFWTAELLHPAILALLPIAISTIMGALDKSFLSEMCIRNELTDCIGVMMLAIAVEHSNIHRRIAIKLLLVFGCSHYRLSFILFFFSMFLSMWFSDILTLGIMIPLVKAVLTELEKMGILEIYQPTDKARHMSIRHEQNLPRPSDFTIFYFLGIAYSSTIGNMTIMMGSNANKIFKIYCEIIFPAGPNIEFPHFMLLNLPGVLLMETLMYMWMNFYFLGMFRQQTSTAIEVGMTEEEAQYIDTLLMTQYQQLGRIKFHEFVVALIVLLSALLQATFTNFKIKQNANAPFHDHIRISSPCIICVILLFLIPKNVDVIKFFKPRSENSDPLPVNQAKSCLNWDLVKREINWSVPFIIAGCSSLFESLRDSGMTTEFENWLMYFSNWPSSAILLVIILVCKILTEFAPSSCVVYGLLPSIAKISVLCSINPHYLMIATTLISSLSFHLVTGSPVNAMVCAYMHIPPSRMMYAGIGPSLIAIIVTWFTAAVWSTAIWTDINAYPTWANVNKFNISNKRT